MKYLVHPRLARACTFIFLTVLAACSAPVGNYFAPTAAVVNGRKIPEERISASLHLALSDPQNKGIFNGANGLKNRLDAQRQVLGDLIQLELVLEKADTSHVSVRPSEVDSRLSQIKKNFPSAEAFKRELLKRGLTVEYIQGRLRDQILTEKVSSELTKGVTVTEEEIEKEYNNGKDKYPQQYHVAHILVCKNFDSATGSCTATDDDLKIAKDVANRARGGEDFSKLAAQYSTDSSTKDKGGDLGFRAPGTFVPEFEQAIGNMQPGQISDPVKTQFGYHVIKLLARGRPLSEVHDAIQAGLLQPQRDQLFREWLNNELGAAHVVVNPKFGEYDRRTFTVVPLPNAQVPPVARNNRNQVSPPGSRNRQPSPATSP